MTRQEKIHQLLNEAANEILGFIKESESNYTDRWVPAAYIKNELELNMFTVPIANEDQKLKGWVFGALARKLEDRGVLEYQNFNNRTYYRSR